MPDQVADYDHVFGRNRFSWRQKTHFHGGWKGNSAGGLRLDKTFHLNPQYVLELNGPNQSETIISLMQKGHRNRVNNARKTTSDDLILMGKDYLNILLIFVTNFTFLI